MPRRLFALALVLLGACKDPSLSPLPFTPNKGTVVLNGYGLQGMTLVPDTGTATSFISLPASFDGAGMRIVRDTALTTSSKAGGDMLYLVDLVAGTKKAIQLPAASNPGGAALVVGRAEANIAVALRDSQAVAFITNPGSATPTVTLRRNVGQCPVDVMQFDVDLYVLDANQNCRTDFSIVGPSRLLRLHFANTSIDTIPLGANFYGATSMAALGSVIYIGAFGQVNFGTSTVASPGMLVKYDMDTRLLLASATMPGNAFGTVPAAGRDGYIYAFVYADAATFQGRVVRMDSTSLSVLPPFVPLTSFAKLLAPDSTVANCAALAVDTRGRLYCPVVGAAGASKMYVYNSNFLLIRNLNVGQGAVAVQAR